jgi:hypothetical protein
VAKFDSRFFIDRANPNRVLFLAIMAAPQIPRVALACLCVGHSIDIHGAAFDTGGSVAPSLFLKKLHGCIFVAAG